MDKKNITIIIGVLIVLAVVLGVGIYLLVKQAPKITSSETTGTSTGKNTKEERTKKEFVINDPNKKPTYKPDNKGEWKWSYVFQKWEFVYEDE